MSDRKIVFVSYWTSKYKAASERLAASLSKFGLEYDIQEAKDDGWEANVKKKPLFIYEMMKKHSDAYAVVWIDADGDVVQKPTLLFNIEEDFGARFLLWRGKNVEELLSGTVFCRNTPAMLKAMEKWIDAIANDKEKRMCPEQQILQAILPKLKITVNKLPEPYCRILPKRRQRIGVKPDSVIVHYQFSRETRYDRAPAAHMSDDTKIGDGTPIKPKKIVGVRPPKPPPTKRQPRRPKRERAPTPVRSRIPAATVQAERRRTIKALRVKKVKVERDNQRTQAALRATAKVKNSMSGLQKVRSKYYGEKASFFIGGVRGYPPTPIQQQRAEEDMASMGHASKLDGTIPTGSTVVIMGNSPTIRLIDPEILKTLPVVGCNRGLRYEEFSPDYLVMGDKEPYCQERDAGRLKEATRKGTKLILSDSIFDPSIMHRGPYENLDRRAQPKPDFPVYLYRIGPRKKVGWSYELLSRGSKKLPVNLTTFSKPVVSCQNVVGSMIATAAILGAKRIAIIGVEMKWPKDEDSHFFGNGRRVGAYPQDGSMKVIVPALKIVKERLEKNDIEIINLSPVKTSPFSKIFGNYPIDKFLKTLDDLPEWRGSSEK